MRLFLFIEKIVKSISVKFESIFFRKVTVFCGVFFLQFIVFFPLSFLNDFQLKITHFIFGDFIRLALEELFNKKNCRIDYSSDSCSMLVLIIILLLTSIIFSFLIKRKCAKRFLMIIEYVCIIYISVILIKYGVDKIFKTQFPEPEYNILFTRFGNLDKDILFWSTMGTSKIYNIIIGSIELFSGALLLFKRSRFLGSLLAIISFSQILIINISFDISVKLFSLILLLMSLFLVRKNGWELILKIIEVPKNNFFDQTSFLPFKTFLKILVIGIVLVNVGMPYFNNDFNAKTDDDVMHLTGVYRVNSSESPYQYLFFHKDQYLIFMEKSSEKMTAFHYDISFNNQIILQDEQHRISKHFFVKNKKDGTINLFFSNQMIHAKAIQYKKMNALQDRFHFLVD